MRVHGSAPTDREMSKMNALVRIALSRPYTFVVLALLLLLIVRARSASCARRPTFSLRSGFR